MWHFNFLQFMVVLKMYLAGVFLSREHTFTHIFVAFNHNTFFDIYLDVKIIETNGTIRRKKRQNYSAFIII